MKKDIVILGAGLSGISAAYHLKGRDFIVIEKEKTFGGLCTSEVKNGYTFDQTGHWLHLSKDPTKKLFTSLFPDDSVQIARKTFVYSNGVYTLYPFQANTYGLPPQVIKECIIGFVKAQYEADKSKAKENFYEWCMAYLGEGISKHFMIPYNSKIYTVHPKNMASHWCDYYVPKPTLEEVVEGAVTAPERKVGYNAFFNYPKTGGIGEFTKRLFDSTEKEKYLFGSWPLSIDIENKTITLVSGETITYNNLISSIPLRDFLGLVKGGFKEKAREIASRLTIASVSYLNVGIKGKLSHPGHWYYIPEEKFMPYRLGSFSNIYKPLAPKGHSSLYIEYTHQGVFTGIDRFKEESLKLIGKMGLIKGDDDVDFMDYRLIPNGYVVFHREYFDDMAAVTDFSSKNGVRHVGRYGRWTYNAMENALLDGMEAAEKIKGANNG